MTTPTLGRKAAGLLVTLVALTPLLAPRPALAQQWHLTYRVHVGGVAVLDAQADFTLTTDRYSIEVGAATEGFLGRVLPWETRSRSDGAVGGNGLVPARHSQVSRLRGEPRNVTIQYDGRGGVQATVTPPPEQDDREPVPDALRQGTQDPLSGVLSAVLAGWTGEGCGRTVPVFDGRRRYDMRFMDQGMRQVGASRYSVFAGVARQCRVTYTPIAGYNRAPSSNGLLPRRGDQEERPPVDLWIAPVGPGGPPVPVRVETSSGLGSVVIHLVDARAAPQTAEKP